MKKKHENHKKEFPRDTRRSFLCPSHSNVKKTHEAVKTYIELNFPNCIQLSIVSIRESQLERASNKQ